jgi:hypothetical protein
MRIYFLTYSSGEIPPAGGGAGFAAADGILARVL